MTSYINNQTKSFTTQTSPFFKIKKTKINFISTPSSWKKYQPNWADSGSSKPTHYINHFLVVDKSL
jgi:hypothetical protein